MNPVCTKCSGFFVRAFRRKTRGDRGKRKKKKRRIVLRIEQHHNKSSVVMVWVCVCACGFLESASVHSVLRRLRSTSTSPSRCACTARAERGGEEGKGGEGKGKRVYSQHCQECVCVCAYMHACMRALWVRGQEHKARHSANLCTYHRTSSRHSWTRFLSIGMLRISSHVPEHGFMYKLGCLATAGFSSRSGFSCRWGNSNPASSKKTVGYAADRQNCFFVIVYSCSCVGRAAGYVLMIQGLWV